MHGGFNRFGLCFALRVGGTLGEGGLVVGEKHVGGLVKTGDLAGDDQLGRFLVGLEARVAFRNFCFEAVLQDRRDVVVLWIGGTYFHLKFGARKVEYRGQFSVKGDLFLAEAQFFETLGACPVSKQKATRDYKEKRKAMRLQSPGHASKIQ